MQPVDRFKLLAAIALADRQLDPAESAMLERAAAGLGLKREAAGQILRELAQGAQLTGLKPPADQGERSKLFRELLEMVLADGQVTDEEQGWLKSLAPAFGVNAWDVPSLLESVAALAGVTKGPPPPPEQVHEDWSDPQREAPTPQAKTGEAACPSCGAPVAFRNSASVARVCEYCDTTVVRQDQGRALEQLGKVSNVKEDASPIRIGASGKAFGVEFEVIGRLQIEHATGYWNEWFLEWADGKSGWLGEALGQYFVTFPSKDAKQADVPAIDELRVGQRLFVGKKRYTVTEVRQARATGTQGETPFAIGEGYELPYADLRRASDGFGTIDYSEDPPLVFEGRCVSWNQLDMRNFRRFDGW
jgi:uncharacterized tellurite resistance protein B-like protein